MKVFGIVDSLLDSIGRSMFPVLCLNYGYRGIVFHKQQVVNPFTPFTVLHRTLHDDLSWGIRIFQSHVKLIPPLVFQCWLYVTRFDVFLTQMNVCKCCTLNCHIDLVFVLSIGCRFTNEGRIYTLQKYKLISKPPLSGLKNTYFAHGKTSCLYLKQGVWGKCGER